jgi:hypothetical protein
MMMNECRRQQEIGHKIENRSRDALIKNKNLMKMEKKEVNDPKKGEWRVESGENHTFLPRSVHNSPFRLEKILWIGLAEAFGKRCYGDAGVHPIFVLELYNS